MLALCSMLLSCYYAQNNASIMCQSKREWFSLGQCNSLGQSVSQTLLAWDSGSAVGEKAKRKKNGVKLVAWGGGKGGGAWRHGFDSAVPWYQILVSCSDWANWLLPTFTQFWAEKPNKTEKRIQQEYTQTDTLKLNSLLHKVLNLHIFPPRNINSTNNNISSGTL